MLCVFQHQTLPFANIRPIAFFPHQTHCFLPTSDALRFANIRRIAFCQHQTHCVLPTSDALRFAIRCTAFCHQMHCVSPISDELHFFNIRGIAFFPTSEALHFFPQHLRHCVFSNIRRSFLDSQASLQERLRRLRYDKRSVQQLVSVWHHRSPLAPLTSANRSLTQTMIESVKQ